MSALWSERIEGKECTIFVRFILWHSISSSTAILSAKNEEEGVDLCTYIAV